MSSIADLRPGDIGFGPLAGIGNPLVGIGQAILGEGFTVGKLNIGHVFVVTKVFRPVTQTWSRAGYTIAADGQGDTQAMCVEAMPHGAREADISDRWTPEYAYVRLPEDYPAQAADAAAMARAMIGTPYSFASYAALAAWRFGWKTPRLEAWINRRRDTDPFELPSGSWAGGEVDGLPAEAICSVLADQAWALTGRQVMPEGTPHQCVTPGALAGALLETPGATWLWPS